MIRIRCVVWMCLGLLAACGSVVPDAPPAPTTVTARLGGDIQVSPATLDFGTRKVGTANDLSVTVTNTDFIEDITVSSIQVTAGTQSFQLAYAPATPLILKAGESAVLKVRFTPTGEAGVTGTLTLGSNATTGTVDVSLSGAGTAIIPPFVVSPSLIDFGTQRVGTTSTKSAVTVSSTGSASSLVITKVHSTHAAFSVVGPSTPFPIPTSADAGTAETLNVDFAPTSRGPISGELIVEGNTGGANASAFTVHVSLRGVGGQPVLKVSPDSLLFDVKPGTPTSFPLTFSNTGNDKLTVSTLTLAGNDAASFSVPSVTPLVLQPGASTPVQVTFSPSTLRYYDAILMVESDDPATPLLQVDLFGYSPCTDIQFSPSLLEFGAQLVGTSSQRLSFSVSNNSPWPVTLNRLSLEGTGASHFSLVAPPSLPIVLQENESRQLEVSFTPSVSGEAAGRAVFTCDAPGSPQVGVDLHGLGISSVLSISPTRLDFGTVDVDAAEYSSNQLVLTNVSHDPVVLDEPKLVSTPSNQFVYQVEKYELEPGESSIVWVYYDPREPAPAVGTLSFPTLIPSLPKAAEVSLVGSAVSSLLEIEPADALLDFGRVDVGKTSESREVRITNRYSTPRQVTRVEVSQNVFQVDASGVKASIASGETATVRVTFKPTQAGVVEDELLLYVLGDDEPLTLSLKGDGRSIGLEGGSGCGSTGGGLAVSGLLALLVLGSRRRAIRRARGAAAGG